MSRRGNSLAKLDGIPAKRSRGTSSSPTTTTPPAPQLQTASPTPAPTTPSWPACGVCNGSNSFSPGNEAPNPWGGYFNFLQQPHFPMPPQQIGGNFSFPPRPHLGENFHFIGHSNNQSPPSPAPPPYTTGTPTENDSIELDDDGGGAGGVASRQVKKRFWTHDEEVKLASAWLNTSKDPIHGNDKNRDSF